MTRTMKWLLAATVVLIFQITEAQTKKKPKFTALVLRAWWAA